tara:strand:+ start:267 stop:467 length:201 start_codon:yes stop_codon:yes gene_type:complete
VGLLCVALQADKIPKIATAQADRVATRANGFKGMLMNLFKVSLKIISHRFATYVQLGLMSANLRQK